MSLNSRIRVLHDEADDFFETNSIFRDEDNFFREDVFDQQRERVLGSFQTPFSSSFFSNHPSTSDNFHIKRFETSIFADQADATQIGDTNQFIFSNNGKSWETEIKLGNNHYSNIK